MAEKVTFKLPSGTKVKWSGVILELVDAVMVVTEEPNWNRIEVHAKSRGIECEEQKVVEGNENG